MWFVNFKIIKNLWNLYVYIISAYNFIISQNEKKIKMHLFFILHNIQVRRHGRRAHNTQEYNNTSYILYYTVQFDQAVFGSSGLLVLATVISRRVIKTKTIVRRTACVNNNNNNNSINVTYLILYLVRDLEGRGVHKIHAHRHNIVVHPLTGTHIYIYIVTYNIMNTSFPRYKLHVNYIHHTYTHAYTF